MRLPLVVLFLSIGLLPAAAARGTQDASVPGYELRVATLQLADVDDSAWNARRDDILAALRELQPDVISIQQVRQQGRRNAACWLANQLRYSCDFITADPPSQDERHGGALLSRLAVEEDGLTLLHPPGRYSAAGMLRLRVEGQPLNIYLARLRPQQNDPESRRHQTDDLMAWITATANGLPSVITGDFAAPTAELVRSTPGFQPARRSPSARPDATARSADGGHGLDVLFQVKSFSGLRQRVVQLPAAGELPALALGMMATLRLQEPSPSHDASH